MSGRAGAGEDGPRARPDATRRLRLLAWVAVVLVVQSALLVAAFNPTPHSGGDNAGYLTLAHSLLERGAYLELWDPAEPPHTKYPPVFPIILALGMLAGMRGWIAFKAISLLFASASVLLTFAWVRERTGALAAAAGVALLFALSDALRWSSHWILSDPPFLAFTLLALWSFDRSRRGGGRWLLAGGAAAILAFFTRSAGLPLVVAAALWLARRRRGRPLALFLVAFGVPAILWWLRARLLGDPTYGSEFWMVNPYDPSAGRAGAGDLLSRVGTNFHLYVGTHLPGGLLGLRFPGMAVAGYLLGGLAFAGWLRRVRRDVGVAELFGPLYFGVILLWPEVWSGDRFALPLYPLALFHAGEALVDLSRFALERLRPALAPRAAVTAAATAFLLLALPALRSWSTAAGHARACVAAVEGTGDPFACHARSTREFVAAARWSAEHLPEDAVVLSRKPRLFFALSRIPSRIFPLSRDPAALAAEAREAGARYVLLDAIDGVSAHYLVPAIRERPDMFCSITGWGTAEALGTELLGLETAGGSGAAAGPAVEEDGTVVLEVPFCDASFLDPDPAPPQPAAGRVPLLEGPRRGGQSSPSSPSVVP